MNKEMITINITILECKPGSLNPNSCILFTINITILECKLLL